MRRAPSLLLILLAAPLCEGNDLGRGFGDEYEWMKLDEGLAEVKRSGKLGMMVIHKSWCGACKSLGPKFGMDVDLIKKYEGCCVCVWGRGGACSGGAALSQ